MLFNLNFTNNIILSCFFFFFLTIELSYLILAAIAQIFNCIVELVITIEEEAKEETEIYLVIAEAKIRKC